MTGRKNLKGLTVRFNASRPTNAMSMWQRTVHVDRHTRPGDFIEDRDRKIGAIFPMSIAGKDWAARRGFMARSP